MKTSLGIAALLLLANSSAMAGLGTGCRFHADLVQASDLAGATKLVVAAAAGDLAVTGGSNAARIEATGKACAPSQALLDQIKLNLRREGSVIYIETRMPEPPKSSGWNYDSPTLDLTITLPGNLPVQLTDSSGDANVTNVAALQVSDTSGDLQIRGVRGDVDVSDSSGDVRINESGRDVRIGTDSSGDLLIDGVRGSVDITNDSSGDIRVSRVAGNVHVGSDSSGDISATDIGGNFTVDADGSGDIDSSNVRGKVTIPEYKRD